MTVLGLWGYSQPSGVCSAPASPLSTVLLPCRPRTQPSDTISRRNQLKLSRGSSRPCSGRLSGVDQIPRERGMGQEGRGKEGRGEGRALPWSTPRPQPPQWAPAPIQPHSGLSSTQRLEPPSSEALLLAKPCSEPCYSSPLSLGERLGFPLTSKVSFLPGSRRNYSVPERAFLVLLVSATGTQRRGMSELSG